MPVRIASTSSQTVFGLTEKFKFNPGMQSIRRRKSHVLHLAAAKPDMVEVTALFQAAHLGTRAAEEEFVYQSPSQYLLLTNTETCTGISPDDWVGDDSDYAIPISYVARSSNILTNIHGREEPVLVSG